MAQEFLPQRVGVGLVQRLGLARYDIGEHLFVFLLVYRVEPLLKPLRASAVEM